jgi:hypothetical protein
MVFMIRDEIHCLQCLMSDPLTEAEAREAVRQQDEATPGLLTWYPCPAGNGDQYHLTMAGAHLSDKRPMPGPDAA